VLNRARRKALDRINPYVAGLFRRATDLIVPHLTLRAIVSRSGEEIQSTRFRDLILSRVGEDPAGMPRADRTLT